jgi:hypothetical protein
MSAVDICIVRRFSKHKNYTWNSTVGGCRIILAIYFTFSEYFFRRLSKDVKSKHTKLLF